MVQRAYNANTHQKYITITETSTVKFLQGTWMDGMVWYNRV